MRNLEINKQYLWVVSPLGEVDVVDDDGNFTGEVDFNYTTPIKAGLILSPADGNIKNELFGEAYHCDLISVSNEVVLNQGDYLFKAEPNDDFDTTYDYKVDKILTSLNSYSYGLKARV